MKRFGKSSGLRLAVVVLSAVMLLGALAVASFAADVAEVRYTTDGGATWTEAAFADAITAVAGQTATIELQKNVTLATTGVTITGGDLTIQSKGDAIYTVTRGGASNNASTDKPCFTLSGAKVTFKNVTLDGKNGASARINGAMILLTTAEDTVILDSGATIQKSKANAMWGGAIYAPVGTIEMKPGSVIRECEALKGGAIALGDNTAKTGATFNMSGGLITECRTHANNSSANGAAVFMPYYSTFNMSSGLITKNYSGRNAVSTGLVGTMIDGAVVALRNNSSTRNIINISGNAVIRDNYGLKIEDDGKASADYVCGADIVYNVGDLNTQPDTLVIAKDFVGSVGLAYSTSPASVATMSVKVAKVAEGAYDLGTVIWGLVDGNANRVAKVMSDSTYIGWADLAAEVDYNGKITRYVTLEDAYAAVGDKAPIKLLANVTDLDLSLETGDTVKLALNGYTVSFVEGDYYTHVTTTEKVGAYTYESYTYAGVDAEVTTYTKAEMAHVCSSGEATASAPFVCSCGKIFAFPTDTAINARYSVDGGANWSYASFADAMSAVSGKTAIVEIYRDVTLTAGLTVKDNLTIRSLPAELNGVEENKTYSIKRGGTFATSVFTVDGGALTFANITLDGQGHKAGVDGAMIKMATANSTLTLNAGATIQNSDAKTNLGGAIYMTAGSAVMNDGAVIRGCVAKKGAGIYLQGCTFTMNGGLITECETISTDGTAHGAAIYMHASATLRLAGGEITENTSHRTFLMKDTANNVTQGEKSFIDGAIGLINGGSNKIYISGDFKIYNNYGRWYEDGKAAATSTIGADIVPCANHRNSTTINFESGFTGRVGIANSETTQIAVASASYAVGTVFDNIVDCNNPHNLATVTASGKIGWTRAEAEVDVGDGSPKAYGTLAAALAAASKADKATVTLLQDVTLTAGTAITGGDVTIQSAEGATYSIIRGSAFEQSMISVSGKLTLKNVTVDGKSVYLKNRTNGPMIALSKVTDEVVLESGATLQNSIRANYGGAIYAPYGTVTMKTGSLIFNGEAAKGGAIYLGNTSTANSAVLNMTGGLITGCKLTTGYTSGAAIYMEGYATFNMSGGLITECESGRNGSAASSHVDGTLVDGAVALFRETNTINLSGDATIRGNKGYRIENGAYSPELREGADIVITVTYGKPKMINVAEDFTGSVGFAYPKSGPAELNRSVAVASAKAWAAGDVIPGLIDSNSNRLASVMSDLLVCWDTAEVEVDYNGKITRYATLADAYAAVGNKAPIKLLKNVTDANIFLWKDQSVKIILNGYTVGFANGTECTSATATEKVGAFTHEGYTYAGVDAEVVTYTATKVTHVCQTSGATETEPVLCSCGKISAFPTDAAKNVRFSTDGGETWTYATFADALAAASEKAVIIEVYRDITLTAGLTVSGDITIRSFPGEINGVDGEKIYTILRGSAFAAPMFTVSGAKLTFADITIDGGNHNVAADGTVFYFAATAATTDTVTFDYGTIVQNAKTTSKNGSVVWAKYGHIVMNDGAVIRNCVGVKGGAIYLGGGSVKDPTLATFKMTGGLITGCVTAPNVSTGHGAALYMTGNATFDMSGGVIAGNTSNRTHSMDSTEAGIFNDGAVGYIYGSSTKIYLSGDATIRNNYGRIMTNGNASGTSVLGADLVLTATHRYEYTIEIAKDFTGSVGISFPTENRVGNVAAEYEVGTVLHGIIDADTGNVAKVTASGKMEWVPAAAEIDVNGKISRYETVDEAYAIAGSETPIKLLSNASITFTEVGESAKIVENGYTLLVVSESGFEKDNGVKTTIGSFTAGEYTMPGYEVTVVTYTAIEGGSVTNVALAAGTDLSLYFYANIGDRFKDSILRVTRGGQTVDLTSTYDESMRLYVFVYRDIAPQCAGDEITVELVCNGETMYSFSGYSVAHYCKQVLAMSAGSLGFTEEKCGDLKTLLRDLLTYCASAQVYRDYNTDALVNEGIEGSKYVLPVYNPKNFVVNNAVDGVTFTEAGLRFYTDNRLWFTFNTSDVANTTLTIGSKTYTAEDFELVSGNTYICYAEALRATQFDSVFTAKLYFGETLVQTGTYSVSAYVQSLVTAPAGKYTDAAIALAKATYNYGVAARIFTGSLKDTAYTVKQLVNTYDANAIGGATLDGTALVMNNAASGIEFSFRGKGDVVLNITASEASRLEITADGQVISHFLVNAGTADYTVKGGLADGKHTIRIVTENGAITLNTVALTGYFAATDDGRDLYIEFVGDEVILGRNIFLNYSTYEDDATDAYAVLAARELGAKYLISATDKKFAATANTPDLVVIDYKSGVDYTKLLADVRAAYGADVKILFVGAMATASVAGETSVNLTKNTTGIDGYPSAGGAAIQGAELAKYIRENYGFFTEAEVAAAKQDIIIEVDAADEVSGYNTFHVYVRASDPSGKYYVRYNFVHQYSTLRDKFGGNTCENISNFRIMKAELVEVTGYNDNKVLCSIVTELLTGGEISTAIKTEGSTDFTGGYHGDEWIRGVDGVDGHLGDEGWIPHAILLADGKQIDIANADTALIFCNTVIFDQKTMMYEWGTSSNDPTDVIAKRGNPLTTHSQYFTITRESGVHNRQSYEWQKDIKINTGSNYMLMFLPNRLYNGKDVCTELEFLNVDGVSNSRTSVSGTIDVSSYNIMQDATNRELLYGGKAGVIAQIRYDLCHVEEFADNQATIVDIYVAVRGGDNKFYARFKSKAGNAQITAGEFWAIDATYGFDYVNPNN